MPVFALISAIKADGTARYGLQTRQQERAFYCVLGVNNGDSKSGRRSGVFEQFSAAVRERGGGGLPDGRPRLHTKHLCLVCCTVLLRVIMRNPDRSAGHAVCAVISDAHTTLRSHRSLPPGEVGGVSERARVTARNWLFCSRYLLHACCQRTRRRSGDG